MAALRITAVAAMLALVAAGDAAAQGNAQVQRARKHFQAGSALYELGNYRDALHQFEAGYGALQRPQFLFNMAQCQRKLGELENARDTYKRYLRESAPNDDERVPAKEHLAEIEKQLAAKRPPQPVVEPVPVPVQSPPPPPPPPAPAPPQPEVAPAQPAPALALAPAEPPPKKSLIKRIWWVIPVTAVVVGVGLGVGIYYGTRPSPCSSTTLGCYTVPQ